MKNCSNGKTNKFCDEPIKTVLSLSFKDSLQQKRHNSYLKIYYKLEYYMTEGCWILFETDNFYITLGYDGVLKYKKPYEFSIEKYEMNIFGDGENPSYEDSIFIGQHICAVEKEAYCTVIRFDDFCLKLYACEAKDERWFYMHPPGLGDLPVPVGVHLLKKCHCGGNPEIYLDHVGDFFVRCRNCHSATLADFRFCGVVEEWNKRNTPYNVTTSAEYFDEAVSTQKLKRILASSMDIAILDDNSSVWTDCVIAEFEKSMFIIKDVSVDDDNMDFVFGSVLDYNKEIYSYVIKPTFGELKYLKIYDDISGVKEMAFELDDTKLYISTSGDSLFISLAEPYENNFVVAKRDKLFC